MAAPRLTKQQELIEELETQFELKETGDRPDLAAKLAQGLTDWAKGE